MADSSFLGGGGFVFGGLKRAEAAVMCVSSVTQCQNPPIANVYNYVPQLTTNQIYQYAPPAIMITEKEEKIAKNISSQLCSTSYQSKPVVKSKRKLTQAEREERKLWRIMANRESARQTIRRRQEMYVELSKKAADALEENESLKKEKELALKEYNYVKSEYEFLKAQLDEVKRRAAGETENYGFTNTMGTPPVYLHNHPSIIPCFWPPIVPSSDVFPFQSASHSQFPNPLGDMPGEYTAGNTMPGAPFFVFPMPWLLPLLAHSSVNSPSEAYQCGRCSCLESRQQDDLSSFQNMRPEPQNSMDNFYRAGFSLPPDYGDHPSETLIVPGLFSPVRPLETCQVDDPCDVNLISHSEMNLGLSRRNQEPVIYPLEKPEDVFAASMARKRRKELMRMRNGRQHTHH